MSSCGAQPRTMKPRSPCGATSSAKPSGIHFSGEESVAPIAQTRRAEITTPQPRGLPTTLPRPPPAGGATSDPSNAACTAPQGAEPPPPRFPTHRPIYAAGNRTRPCRALRTLATPSRTRQPSPVRAPTRAPRRVPARTSGPRRPCSNWRREGPRRRQAARASPDDVRRRRRGEEGPALAAARVRSRAVRGSDLGSDQPKPTLLRVVHQGLTK